MDLSNPSMDEMMSSETSDEYSSSEAREIPGPSNPSTGYISEISKLKHNEMSELASLGVCAYDHSELEKDILEKEKKKRKEKDSRDLKEVETEIQEVQVRLCHIDHAISVAPKNLAELEGTAKEELRAIEVERQIKKNFLKTLASRQYVLQERIFGSTQVGGSSSQEVGPVETEREQLIRMGEITPFGSRIISVTDNTAFDRFLLNSSDVHESKKAYSKKARKKNTNRVVIKNDKLDYPYTDLKAVPANKRSSPPKKKKRKITVAMNSKSDSEVSCSELEQEEGKDIYSDSDVYKPTKEEEEDDDDEYDDDYNEPRKGRKGGAKKKAVKLDGVSGSHETKSKAKKLVDDGNQASYLKRIKAYEKSELNRKYCRILESADGVVDSDEEDFTQVDGGFKVPNSIWDKLYKYQKTCVHWLWELHNQNVGGIVGDEMGLGKTIQVIAFLAGLYTSNLETLDDNYRGLGPVLLVCPTTVMHQWVKEFHTWWPPVKIAILHDSGSYIGKKGSLISTMNKQHGVLVVSYSGLVAHQDRLLAYDWHYVILDEGHKIRNPDVQATITAKRFRTCHRLVLTGSPIQNNLIELWSLFDFIYPGKLGTLPVFLQEFSIPITQGGYANASQIQVQTGYKCATVLRDAIQPYLLRRMKSDVKMNLNLPNKSEQVLFCQFTREQEDLYKGYVNSKEVRSILDKKLQVFVGLINLRKICNHPDLFDGGPKIFKDTDVSQLEDKELYGYYGRSGKMLVVESLLRVWKSQGHRVLLFTQSRQMLCIFELFVQSKGYSYMKMDGTTSIASRQPAINKFNSDSSVFVFLLTTRVGGVGVNLTGADRVVIYDPDWNPSTDAQARERAWRIGQKRQVTVYRLLTAGTIEEKMYHRQIFKQFMTDRVLKDPKQRRFFKSNDLLELFSYSEVGIQGTETSCIFAGTGSEINRERVIQRNKRKKSSAKEVVKVTPESVIFSDEKREKMMQEAKRLSMAFAKTCSEAIKSNSNISSKIPSATTLELNSKNNLQANSGTTNELNSKSASGPSLINLSSENRLEPHSETPARSDLKSTKSPDAKSVTTVRPEQNSHKTLLTEEIKSVKRASDPNTVKGKDKVSSKDRLGKKSQKKSKKKRGTRIEGEEIEFVVKRRTYVPPEDEEEKSKREDDYVLSKLFKTSGVHTVIRHDTIVESSRPDYAIVLEEAQRVANAAVQAVRESRRYCSGATSGIPNPTRAPRFGQKKRLPPGTHPTDPHQTSPPKSKAHRDSTKAKFNGRQESGDTTSSSDLLAAIRKRKGILNSGDRQQPSSTNMSKNEELLVDIQNFVAYQQEGQASTNELVAAFVDKVNGEECHVFKAMLNKICYHSKTESGEGLWKLKEKYRELGTA